MDRIVAEILSHREVVERILNGMVDDIKRASTLVVDRVQSGKKILLCGNGGSAADAQHIAAEFTGRFRLERRALNAIALTTDTSALTAIANDYGYDRVFSRQIEAVGDSGDVLIAISTSGNSPNVIEAIKTAKRKDISVIGFSGRDGGAMRELVDVDLTIPSENTARIQEMHIMIGHILCMELDEVHRISKL
jgi:D-sedoheptulose 7-phosphate isomerase